MARALPVILIVEDCAESVPALEIALQSQFVCAVEHYAHGSGALAALRLRPETILALITDLNLPDLDGWEIIRRVRSLPGGRNLPVIAISADPHPLAAPNALAAGADAFVGKPYSPLDLCRRLKGILHAKEMLEPAPAPPGEPARPTGSSTTLPGDLEPGGQPPRKA